MSQSNRNKFFHYIFVTAMEGGISYWAVREEYVFSKTEGKMSEGNTPDDIDNFYAIISNSEDDWGVEQAYVSEQDEVQDITEDQLLRVDLKVIQRGWTIYYGKVMEGILNNAIAPDDYRVQFVIQFLTNGEEGDSDSDEADLVVQYGLFGEIVYG